MIVARPLGRATIIFIVDLQRMLSSPIGFNTIHWVQHTESTPRIQVRAGETTRGK